MTPKFSYREWTLGKALDYLRREGVRERGSLTRAVREYLLGLSDDDFRVVISRHVREKYMKEIHLKAGKGIGDVLEFVRWVEDELRITVYTRGEGAGENRETW
jgi:hypothetical protein